MCGMEVYGLGDLSSPKRALTAANPRWDEILEMGLVSSSVVTVQSSCM